MVYLFSNKSNLKAYFEIYKITIHSEINEAAETLIN